MKVVAGILIEAQFIPPSVKTGCSLSAPIECIFFFPLILSLYSFSHNNFKHDFKDLY